MKNQYVGILAAIMLSSVISGQAIAQKTSDLAETKQTESGTVSSRQAIDSLLEEANRYYRSPARISTPGAASKLPDNMRMVIKNLKKASRLAPWRADLLFSQASAYIHMGQVDNALNTWHKILDIAPEDTDALSYIATWETMQGNAVAANSALTQLKTLSPERAIIITRLLDTVNKVTASPLMTAIPASEKLNGPVAIVTLGFALEPDGTMNTVLVERLETTLKLAIQYPEAKLIVTGGVPKNHRTEAQMMAQWLMRHGINKNRIFQDNFARTSVENAQYSRYILARERIKNALIVTSPGHLHRSLTLFTLASKGSGPHDIRFTGIAASEGLLESEQSVTKKEKLFIYRDTLKAIGLWSFRSPPLEEL